ncbi:hypothetical protein [Deinococcus alpinitundrae]|uniref:hypothetical protein n=1 Tax=Deinococcus alpinitundrae TaxID=468913 RepID=UPI00137B6A36|nr:hypothetical protein [Deinococcus alpinitundrae]
MWRAIREDAPLVKVKSKINRAAQCRSSGVRHGGGSGLRNSKLIRGYIAKHPHFAARVPDLLPALKQAEVEESISTVLARQLDQAGVNYIEEHRFHPPRRWSLGSQICGEVWISTFFAPILFNL